MKKEYGGYLPIELPKGRAYYQGHDVIALNAGRYAIVYALQEAGWNTIFLPYYICDTVEEAIQKYLPNIRIQYYHIDENLLPISVFPRDNEGILWVNYFGVQPENVVDYMAEKYYGHIIIDNTQSFYTAPRKGAYQVYSCRKFFGVCDGSYVICENISHRPMQQLFSSLYSVHLLHSFEHGTHYSYDLSKKNEERLGICDMAAMSPLTSAILDAVDYSSAKQRRIENTEALHQILGPYNQFPVLTSGPIMSYPFLHAGEGLRKELTRQKIYIPKLWKETASNNNASPWEVYLSEHLCLLPIDQRYTESDMNIIGSFVLQTLNASDFVRKVSYGT